MLVLVTQPRWWGDSQPRFNCPSLGSIRLITCKQTWNTEPFLIFTRLAPFPRVPFPVINYMRICYTVSASPLLRSRRHPLFPFTSLLRLKSYFDDSSWLPVIHDEWIGYLISLSLCRSFPLICHVILLISHVPFSFTCVTPPNRHLGRTSLRRRSRLGWVFFWEASDLAFVNKPCHHAIPNKVPCYRRSTGSIDLGQISQLWRCCNWCARRQSQSRPYWLFPSETLAIGHL
jgi:hypothetical protein